MPLEGKGDVMPLPNRDLSDWEWIKDQIAATLRFPTTPATPTTAPTIPTTMPP
jgi:hypothetical protein